MRTLLCAFDDRETARQAMARLIVAGVPREDVHIQPDLDRYAPPQKAGASANRGSANEDRAVSLQGAARALLRWFSGPVVPGPTGTYRDAIRRGSAVVVVHAVDDDEEERAHHLMASFGAFDIERRERRAARRGCTPG